MTETYLPNPATTEPVMSVSGDQPLYSHATDTEPHAEPPLAPVTDDWMMHEESGLDQELGRTGFTLPHAATGPDSHDKPAGTRNEAAIVGRYVSGDTTYVMFADGSIEAETPDGLLRFATIGDLRHFIEARA